MKKIWKKLQARRKERLAKKKQTTFIYCACGNEMVADMHEGKNQSFIRDVYVNDRNVVHYNCSKCKKDSYFDLDFPAPVELPLNAEDNIIEKYQKAFCVDSL